MRRDSADPVPGTARAADEARLSALFQAHYGAIARYFRTRGHAAADADDLVAATFEVAWRRLDAVPAGESALPWLYGVARNLSRNARRSGQREAAFVDALIPTARTSDEIPVEGREEFAETMRALAQLPTADRELIMLVTWDELSPSDAGRVLGLRPVAARSRLHRARRRLSALLDAERTPPAARHTVMSATDAQGGSRDA